MVFIASFNIMFSIGGAVFVYLMMHNLAMSEESQSLYWTVYTILVLAQLPIIMFLANKLGKKISTMIFTFVLLFGCIYYYFNGFNNLIDLYVYTVLWNFGNATFWTIGYSLMYDCCEVDEFITGKNREASVTGLSSFVQKVGAAIGMGLTGVLLQWIGYDGNREVQPPDVLHGITLLNTLVLGIFAIIVVVSLIGYPISKKNYQLLLEALKLRKEGREYSTEGFEKLLPKNFVYTGEGKKSEDQ
jgi:GPH family glycoside/pentoside/hexuronide:cation symporter